MGLFDFFKRDRGNAGQEPAKPVDRKIAGAVKTASDKRAQAYDRSEAIRQLTAYGTPDAVDGLLKRFALKVDPSITDEEEKQLAFDGIVQIGKGQIGKRLADAGKPPKEIDDSPLNPDEVLELQNVVVDATTTFCARAENLNWALKVLAALLESDAYEEKLLSILGSFDTEYTRNVEPKVNLLAALEHVHSTRAREAIEAYLDDVNETVRFHAVQTVFQHENQLSLPALVTMVQQEESVRIKNKVAEGIANNRWTVPEDLRDALAEGLSDAAYRLSGKGAVLKRN